jgi:uncharacterized protein (DUF2336 family)
MSELQTLGQKSTGLDGTAVRPRISADAFRNLAARLKQPATVVPDMQPVPVAPMVEAAPEISLAPPPLQTFAPPEPPVATIEVVQPALEPAFAPSVVDVVQPVLVSEVAAPLALQIEEPAQVPVKFEAAPALAFPPLELPPGFAPVVPKVEETVAFETPVAVSEAGSFEDNFTYVPEKGEALEATKPDLSGVKDAIKAEIAQRAVEIELENIWRMMLATPTHDDRSNYLREAAEIHSGDEEWNKPAPEHDLSRIEPALVTPAINHPEYDPPADENFVKEVAVASPPAADGQDLSELARSLLDMMAAGNASGLPQERALAADTLLRLVPKLEMKPLIMLAERLAMMDSPPHMLVAKLIRDPRVEISGPLLEDCSQISDRDLESVVAESEPDKLRMIARRRNLSRAMSEVLIKSGDPSVVLTLVRNMEAEISHEGFQSLLVLAENHEELLAPMATRQDFTAQYAFEMFWLAPAQLRRFILSRFLTDSETLTKILKITMATKLEEEGEAEPLNQHVLLEGLERAARGQIERAAEELSGTMQLSTATIQKILSDLQGDALVVMLKAAGYPRSAVSGLLKRMQTSEMPLVSRDRDVNDLQNMFETLSFNKARILLTYWDWAQSKTGPYALAH